MNKEPIALYIFRFILGLGLFAFMAMLYWSTVLIENDLSIIRTSMSDLKNDIFNLRSDFNKFKVDLGETREVRSLKTQENHALAKTKAKQEDPSLANLLIPDPFYEKTLPEILGKDFKPYGTFSQSTLGKYDHLHPFSNWGEVAGWIRQCNVNVAKGLFGKYETLSPDMALKMEGRNLVNGIPQEYWVHLREGVYWQPLKQEFFSNQIQLDPHFFRKHPVTAHDFKFYYDAVMNPHNQEVGALAARTLMSDIEKIEVLDDVTFVVYWKVEKVKNHEGETQEKVRYIAKLISGSLSPLASFVYKYFPDGKKIIEDDADPETYRKNSVWAQNFSQHWAKNIIVSCGPWLFDGRTERQIKFIRNPDFYFPLANLMEKMEVTFKESSEGEWQDFKIGKSSTYNLRPDQLLELENFRRTPQYQEQAAQNFALERLDYLSRSFTFVGWNEAKPFFKNSQVRRAMTMAIDRRRIVNQYLNGMGVEITGPFFPESPNYDKSIEPWPFDPQSARKILAEEGWIDRQGNGILEKEMNGKWVPFRFSITYYVKNQQGKNICEYISTALKEIGVLCELNGVDIADLSASTDDKSFDAIYLAWGLGTPPEDLRQIWSSAGAKEKGSSNFIGFANPEVDRIINVLDYEYDKDRRIELYHRFHQIIHEEVPYTFLYTPKVALLYRQYLQNVFIPRDRQDLVPGADIGEPDPTIYWIKAAQ